MDWSFWDFLWTSLMIFFWVMFLVLFINTIVDIFRSKDLGGFAKAIWVLVVAVLPFFGVLIYLIARGDGMGVRAVEREVEQAQRVRAAVGQYAAESGPAGQLAEAKRMADEGAITPEEYERLKAKILG